MEIKYRKIMSSKRNLVMKRPIFCLLTYISYFKANIVSKNSERKCSAKPFTFVLNYS